MRSQGLTLLRAALRAALRAGAAGAPGANTTTAAAAVAARRAFADDASLAKTALYDYHVAHGGKMVPFAGWSMPIQYGDSIMDSVNHCRTEASLFDVSHMCGLTLKGKDAVRFLEGLVVGDVAGLPDGTGTLSVLTNEQGGIIDDTVVTKVSATEIYIVVNAGCREKDLAHFRKHLAAFDGDVKMEVHDDRALLALQGPRAAAALQPLVAEDLDKIYFGNFRRLGVAGAEAWLTRTGYTGEDGFELSLPNDAALKVAEFLVGDKLKSGVPVRLCGLGARDSLRLEAGLCLYGNDMDETRTPVEAGLAWTIGKRRREDFSFLGGAAIRAQLADGVAQRRVGLVSTGAPARQHSEILDLDGKVVGEVTSGGFSPVLKKNVAMGYVDKALAKAGTPVKVSVRGRVSEAVVTKMPFVPVHYHRPS